MSTPKTPIAVLNHSHGKTLVRLVKVHRPPGSQQHRIADLTVEVLLHSPALDTSYSVGDNSLVVPTDTVKNTVYYLAKRSTLPALETPEKFALEIANHFLGKYKHVESVTASIVSHRWARIPVTRPQPDRVLSTDKKSISSDALTAYSGPGTPTTLHPFSFYRDSEETRRVVLSASRDGTKVTAKVSSHIVDLYVLKTTGSWFVEFWRDDLPTLKEAHDRLFSTMVNASWNFAPFEFALTSQEGMANVLEAAPDYDSAFDASRQIIMDVFSNHDSPSVQNTLYRMGEMILEKVPDIVDVTFKLPNKHIWAVNLAPFNLNNEGKEMDTYAPQHDPSGLIIATLARNKAKL